MPYKIIALFLLAGTVFAQTTSPSPSTGNGIFVDQPKVYDDYYLQSQLDGLKARLAAINAADQSTLLGKIGGLQGATMQQSGIAVQGLGAPTPTVTTVGPFPGQQPSSSSSVTWQTTPTTPAAPTPPAPTLTVPSTFSPSSLDTLNEEMQLSSQIINLQLLLDGALNDRTTRRGIPKRRVTVGFSINVDPPESMKKKLQNSVAEVEITLKNPPAYADYKLRHPESIVARFAPTEGPSVVTLLPKEKTYNVASLIDKSVSIGGGGIIAGIVNAGGSWLWGKKTYYLVQQQDTLSLQEPVSDESASKFVWQFRPVLGRKFVSSGTRQTFVQFSVPVFDERWDCSAEFEIQTGWRTLDLKTGLVSDELAYAPPPQKVTIPYFNAMRPADSVDVSDMGAGSLSVTAETLQSFMSGTHFRIGNTIIDSSYPSFFFTEPVIRFTASAKDVSGLDVMLVSRDGREMKLYSGMSKTQPSPLQCGMEPESEAPAPSNTPPTSLTSLVSAVPFSDSQSLLTIKFSSMPEGFADHLKSKSNTSDPIVVVIGDKVYGLSDAPFRSTNEDSIALVVPTDLLRTNRTVRVSQLLFGPRYTAVAQLDPIGFPSINFAISSASIVSAGDPQIIAVTGSGLKDTTLSVPMQDAKCMTLDSTADTLMYLNIQKACVDKYKQIVLKNGDNPPALLTVPTAKSEAAANKPSLKPQDSIAPNTSKITITGSGLDQISAIRYGKTRLGFTLSLKKDSVVVVLTPEITASEGVQYLDVTFSDGTKSRYELTIKKPS